MPKISIYQVFPRLFGNKITDPVFGGSRERNGVGKMNDFTPLVLQRIKELGITHIWYTGLIEHARCTGDPEYGIGTSNPQIVKGRAGSPYAINDYYDIDPDIAESVPDRIREFEELLDRTHQQGMKVIIDFVPNHVARQYRSDIFPDRDFGKDDDQNLAFSPMNDFYYIPGQELHLPADTGTICPEIAVNIYHESPAKATGNDQFSAYLNINDWYETVKLNYGVDYQGYRQTYFVPQPPVWQKMVDILLYWAQKGVDGFRCDMAEMVPVEFWSFAINAVKMQFPNVEFFAEVYNPGLYSIYIERGGFNYLYDKVGLYDALRSIICHDGPAHQITQCWRYLNGLDAWMLRFMENHDEQRIASPQFAGNPQLAIPAMIVSATLNKGPVMIYSGQEVGEPAVGASGYSGDDGRTTIFDYYNIPNLQRWYNQGKVDGLLLNQQEKELRLFYQNLLNLTISEVAISEGKFYDLMWANSQYGGPDYKKIYAYLRYTENDALLFIVNFDRNDEQGFLFKIPEHAWNELYIEMDKLVSLKPIFGVAPSLSFDARHIADSGFWITIKPMDGVIYKLSW